MHWSYIRSVFHASVVSSFLTVLFYIQILPAVADSIIALSTDIQNKDIVYSLLLVLSGILMDSTGETTIIFIEITVLLFIYFDFELKFWLRLKSRALHKTLSLV